jgi:phage tail sheath protein FI
MSSFNVGLNVVEVDGRVAPSIQAAPTSVAAFIIRAERGLPDAVRRITNLTEFTQHFGSYIDGANGAYAVRGFFENGGGVAYVTRVVGAAADPATLNLNAGDAAALAVTAGYRGSNDPGTWGDRIAVRVINNTEVQGTYDLVVGLAVGDTIQVVETWERLNNSDADGSPGTHPELRINDEFSGSRYITVSEESTTNPTATADFTRLEDGANDTLSGNGLQNALAAALPRFDSLGVQLVACPESDDDVWVNAALAYCAGRGDCMFVGHTPFDLEADAAKAYGKDFQGSKVYGALYFPWIRVADPIGTRKWIPPTGHVMGVYARTERERGIWKAPAGVQSQVRGALEVRHAITDAVHTDLVKNGSVNAVRFVPGQGIIVDSSRTLSTSPLWYYVNVRLLFNFVKSSLMLGLRWVVQEPNDATLWNKVKFNSITPFLMGLWRQGAFGAGAPEDLFTIKIDSENNPPDQIQQGFLTIEVYFYPSRPAETIVIIVGQQEAGASASEA